MLIFGHDREIAQWVGHRIGIFDFGPCTAIGIMHGARLIAGAVFHAYRHPDIQFSFASESPRWGTREIIRGVFRYPFVQLNCKRITCICPAKNAHAIRQLERLGFAREGFHPNLFPDDDGISIALQRDVAEERWLR
jgi:RimJ/RimL family protein N-acetyltransferase